MSTDPWIERHITAIPANGLVLDLACGRGRHTEFALQHGLRVLAVDKDTSGVQQRSPELELLQYDLEASEWPFPPALFDGIIVCNYLHRPLMPHLAAALQPNGVLLYTTFMQGQEAHGRPRNPDFLLRTNELRDLFNTGFTRIAFEQGAAKQPTPAVRQSICVRKHAAKTIVSR